MIGARFFAPALAVFVGATAFAADAIERKFIREGMGEGEVLLKIGEPDHEAFICVVSGEPEEKTWSYFPHARDPQTLTIVTCRRVNAGQEPRLHDGEVAGLILG